MTLRVKKKVDSARVERLFGLVEGRKPVSLPREFDPQAYPLFDEEAVRRNAVDVLHETSVNRLLEETGFDWSQEGVSELSMHDAGETLGMLKRVLGSGKPVNKKVLLPFMAKKEAWMRSDKPMKLAGDSGERLGQTATQIRDKISETASAQELEEYASLVKAYQSLYESAP